MDFDEILVELGEFGRYQAINYLLVCLPVFFGAANSLSYVFTTAIPRHRCAIPVCDNETSQVFDAPWVPDAVPPASSSSGPDFQNGFSPAQCKRYVTLGNYTLGNYTLGNYTLGNDTTAVCPLVFSSETEDCGAEGWVFDPSDIKTIVEEWNITCDSKQWLLALVGTVHFAGIFAGTVLSGLLADRFGRKSVFILCILFMSATGVGQGLASNYDTFQAFVFLNAFATSGVFPLAFIIGVELVGKSKREMCGIVLNYFYAAGEAAVALVAYFMQDWTELQLIVSAPAAIFVVYCRIVPESVRWLLAQGKTKQALRIIRRAARVNGVELSEHLLQPPEPDPSQGEDSNGEEVKTPGLRAALGQVCRSPKLILRALVLFLIWASSAFVFYGMSLNSTSLGGNKYLNFALVCLIEIPGYTAAWLLMPRFGRRRALASSLILSAATCFGAALAPAGIFIPEWLEVVFFLTGKFGVTSAFGVLFVYTAELYPTPMRSAGVGASSTIARLGAMVAPFAPLLGQVVAPLPLLLFGGVALFAGFLAFVLPETNGSRLPDTVEELEEL